ncbi:hypothetical protein VNO78_12258 [Psophocarpus tetragonolobus]|uniref:Uncharacterized protein n=1 Tax=Psophocarpus tetragonolobus TaxID=3891 RepID=A0AAN9SMP1_PSOTE
MEDQSFFYQMIKHLRSTCKYYTGYPKDLGPSKVAHFTSEREFIKLLHEGFPVVVAFTIRIATVSSIRISNTHKRLHLVSVLPPFYVVECPKYPGFCITRQKKEYPFIEIFYSPTQAANQGRVADPNITKYNVKVLPFNYDVSAYGFREFFKRHDLVLPLVFAIYLFMDFVVLLNYYLSRRFWYSNLRNLVAGDYEIVGVCEIEINLRVGGFGIRVCVTLVAGDYEIIGVCEIEV